MGVAVVVALAPLPVRGQEVEGVDSSCRPLGSLLVPARTVCGRGLLTATARGVGALGLAVTGLDPLFSYVKLKLTNITIYKEKIEMIH